MIDAQGNQLGILSREEALQKAQEQELDLVEVAPNAQPPVARITEFEKFKYKEDKKEQAAKKNMREVSLKEIWLSPRIAQHDLETRLRKAEEFLGDGNRVKLTIKFKGREMAHPETGYKVVGQALAYLGDKISVERETKFEGRNLTTIIGQAKGKPDAENQNKENIN